MAKKSLPLDGSDRQSLGRYNRIGGADPAGYLARRDAVEQMRSQRPDAGMRAESARPARAVLLTPAGNTGVSLHQLAKEQHNVHIDYYRMSIWADAGLVQKGITWLLGDGPANWCVGSRGRFFERSWVHTSGVVLRSGLMGAVIGEPLCSLELSGDVCAGLSWSLENHRRLVELCALNGWRVQLTRLDVAIDGAAFSPADLRARFDAGMADKAALRASGGRAARSNDGVSIVTELRANSWRWFESPDGTTLYLGSRTSDKTLRCYDKRGFTRVELELKGDVAHVVGTDLLSVFDWRGFALGLVRGFVDFPEWQQWRVMIEGRAPVKVSIPARRSSYERALAWVRGSVLPTIDALCSAVGDRDFIRKELERDTRSRSKSQIMRHQVIVASSAF